MKQIFVTALLALLLAPLARAGAPVQNTVPWDRTRVIPLAPALPIRVAQPPPGPYLLAVGDLRPKKNLGRLVRA